MAFKWKRQVLPGIAREGKIHKKHSFKIERASLPEGTLGEAHPGRTLLRMLSIFISYHIIYGLVIDLICI